MLSPLSRSGVLGVVALPPALPACTHTWKKDSDAEPGAAGESAAWEFVPRPDLTPPKIEVSGEEDADEERLVLLAPKDRENGAPMNGNLITRPDGDPVWIQPLGDTRWTYDLRVQEYNGFPVLTWWRGDTFPFGYGEGEFVIMGQDYREITTVTTPDTHADFHDGTITEQGTMLMISYPVVKKDLTEVGGPVDGYLRNSVVYEVDIDSGKVLLKWSALDHIPLSDSESVIEEDSEEDGTQDAPYDPYHVNSVTADGKDALLVSARNTHAVYQINRKRGNVFWTLGGKSSDFEMADGSAFAWQHDAQRQDDGTISMFDNEAAPQIGDSSRGLILDVDTDAMTASVVQEFLPPEGQDISESQGNLSVLDDGTYFVGWGSVPFYTHYDAEGEVLSHGELAGGISYRAYLQEWEGLPAEPPKMVVKDGHAYASWNGATEVDSWRFVAGPSAEQVEEVATVEADSFEVSAEVPDEAYLAVHALDEKGEFLAMAEPGSWPLGVS